MYMYVLAMSCEYLPIVFANINRSDQSAHMRSLVSAYVVHFQEKVIAICISVFG